MLLEHDSRRFAALHLAVRGGVEARQLVLSPVSLEYTPCKSWPLWCGVLTFAYLRPSRSRRPLYERVNHAARLHRIHDMRNWCICPRWRRRWTGKLDSTWCARATKKVSCLSQPSSRANGIAEMNSRAEREKRRSTRAHLHVGRSISSSPPIFFIALGMRGSECQTERCDKIKESLQTHVWPNQRCKYEHPYNYSFAIARLV
jgi:hypothetical protein